MRSLSSDDDVPISRDGGGAKFGVHLIQTLFQPASHPIPDDIQESQNAHLGAIDDFLLLLQEVFAACRTCIDDGGHARLQRHIRRDAKWESVRSGFRSEPVERRSSVADVVVNIDQSRCDQELRNIHNLSRLIGRNIFFDSSYLALEY